MQYVILGALALGVLVAIAQLAVKLDPHTLIKVLRYVAGAVLAVGGLVLSLAGRFGLGIPAILLGLGVIFTGRLGSIDFGTGTRSRGKTSKVRARFVEASLDHDSGTLKVRVVAGTHAGRSLDDLDDEALRELLAEAGADPESRVLIEAYLDRRSPGWREHGEEDGAAGAGGAADPGAMTDEEAYEILGLLPGAGEAEIRAAHRRLMKGVHPDHGGSSFLAARINQAKDRLLGKHG